MSMMTAVDPSQTSDPSQTVTETPAVDGYSTPSFDTSALAPTHQQAAPRLQYLADNHPWMDPQLMMATATAPIATDQMAATANYFKGVLTGAWDGWQSTFDDPVLAKRPSTALVVKRFFDGTTGPYPVVQEDIGNSQQTLQKLGFGQQLPASGVWSPEWNAAYKQYTQQLIQNQYAGKKPGGTTVGNAVRNILGSFLPKKAADAIVGMVASTPHSIRQLAADVVMAAATPVDLIHGGPRLADTAGGFVMGQTPEKFASGLFGGTVTGFDKGGVPTYAANTDQPHFLNMVGRAVGDAGTIMLLGDGLRVGSNLGRAAGEVARAPGFGLVPDLTYAEAARGPGVIANSLSRATGAAFATPVRGALVGAAAGGVTAGLTGNNPLVGAAIGAGLGIAGGSNVFDQIPVLGRTGAVLGSLADENGMYYKARSLLAQPYRLPAVRAAGDAVGQLGVYGAKVRGVAALSGDSELAKAVQDSRVGEVADQFLHRVTAPVFNDKFSVGLDDLAFLLHPTTLGGGQTVSQTIGSQTSSVVDAISHALGDTGAIAEAERGTGKSWPDLVKAFGGETNAYQWLAKQVKEHAAYADSEAALAALGDSKPTGTLDRIDFLRAHAQTTYNDAAKLDPAVERLLSNTGELASRINRQITNSALAAGRNAGAEALPGVDYFSAVNLMRDHVLPLEPDFQAGGMMIGQHNAGVPDPFAAPGSPNILPDTPTQLGLMKTSLSDQQQLSHQIAELRAQVAGAQAEGATGDVAAKADRELAQFLFSQFGVDGSKMPQDLSGKLDKADEMAKRVATRVYPALGMDDSVKAAFQQIHDLGYKVVAGKDIGHMFAETGDEPWLSGPLTARRRLVSALGFNPDRIETRNIGRVRADGVVSAVQAAADAGKIDMPPLMDARSLISHVFDQVGRQSTGYLRDVATTLARGTRRNAISAIADGQGVSADVAAGLLKQEMNQAAYFNVRDIPRQKVVDVLTSPRGIPDEIVNALAHKQGLEWGSFLNDVPLMDEPSANAFYRAAVQGAATPPSYMMGAARIEDLARAGMGMVGDKLAPNWLQDTGAYSKVVNLPNRMVQLRNELRFTLDPYFSFRRVTKTNVKLGLEGVTPTLFPLQHMIDNGTYNDARNLLNELRPGWQSSASDFSDDADRYLHSNDVFGFYDARNYERYAAIEMQKAGKSNDEIDQALTRAFGYGNAEGEGRSAAERTANFVFFPFSFDKTLYRNVGGYLLDHPAQQILLDRGLRAYKQFNDQHLDGSDPLAASWFQKHLPILSEAAHLNAFAYGLSAGQPGGLNLPLLNMFLPQSWAGSAAAVKTLQGFIPAAKDFNRLTGELQDQSQVAYAGLHNSVDDLVNGTPQQRGVLWSQPAAEGKYAQFTDAFQMRQQLYQHFANSIAANGRLKDDKQIVFNNPAYGKWNGVPITKGMIDQIVQARYPQYSPIDSKTFAAAQQDALVKYRLSLQGTPGQEHYDKLLDVMTAAATRLRGSGWTPAVEAQVTAQVRHAAAFYAEQNPAFYAMYQKHFAGIFGPLERVTG